MGMGLRSVAAALTLASGALVSLGSARCEDIASTPEFRLLCTGFHQDIGVRGSSIENIVDEGMSVLKGHRSDEIDALKAFLDEVLSGRYAPEEINRLWNTCPADVYVTGPHGGEALLKAVRDRLDQPPFPTRK